MLRVSDEAVGYRVGSTTDTMSAGSVLTRATKYVFVFPNSEASIAGCIAHVNEIYPMQFRLMLENKLDCSELVKIYPF